MTLKEKIKKIEDSLDMKKKFPNYFNKIIFRSLTIIMLTLFIISLYLNNWNIINVYAECQQIIPCKNPFYECSQNNNNIIKQCPINKIQQKIICSEGICDKEYIQPNENIGQKPHWFYKHFTKIIIILYILGFVINHILYLRKTK